MVNASANLGKSPIKPSNESDSVARNLRRRDSRTVQDQACAKSKPIRKTRHSKPESRRISNDSDDASEHSLRVDDFKQLLKDKHVKSSPKNVVLRKIL